MAANDPKDDVDRLFACFKCGVSPPQSAFRERPRREGKRSRVASVAVDGCGGGSSSAHTPYSAEKVRQCLLALLEVIAKMHVGGASDELCCDSLPTPAWHAIVGGDQVYRPQADVPRRVLRFSARCSGQKPLSLLRLLREIRIDLKKQTDLVPSAGVWATFPRQEEAIRFCKAHANTSVFSYQDHLSGQRRFLVSTYDEFWKRYDSMDPQIRHHYEVIQDGSPCHIYFDLEFDARLNKMRDADEMVDIWSQSHSVHYMINIP
ncbi:hypothetical protein GUJ93_ZPchr0007g4199 [Zizania palustris]|uniref:DNA-directed primase/polymerase protein n=1 Tax=Zizania palustris TaxID=103762 RepID=A0A8J5T9T0_ZIZPA|nr:hypothetical protein GUJ93_ZPchr0007g4199 [Zizania palustris]